MRANHNYFIIAQNVIITKKNFLLILKKTYLNVGYVIGQEETFIG